MPTLPEGCVLVVGGSGGIGRAVCRVFAEAGADVALTYHAKKDVAHEVVTEVEKLGRRARAYQLTLGDAQRVEQVVEEVASDFRSIHTVLVGAGSLAEQVLVSEMSHEQWRRVIDQDLNGFHYLVQATLPRLKAWGGGSYVHLGSAGMLRWPERDVMSVAPKAAIEALMTGIAREEGRHGIRANSVLVGVIEAGMFLELSRQGAFDEQWVRDVQAALAIPRWGRPEEIGHAAVYLASDEAAYVTGQRICVGGGYGL
jgi:NAD(P)-dependent dehydrogenase (short-subunit alcohol dehydrogenase family)